MEVSPGSHPSVCRLMNFGKYKYEQNKKMKDARKKQRGEVKEIKITRSQIAERDLQVKVNHLTRFLEHGDKAKVIVEFRGREQLHINRGFDILNNLIKRLEPVGTVERKPTMEGRRIIMVLAPKKVERRASSVSKEEGQNLQDSSQAV